MTNDSANMRVFVYTRNCAVSTSRKKSLELFFTCTIIVNNNNKRIRGAMHADC